MFVACVDLLHNVPSVALRGASMAEVVQLLRMHESQMEESRKQAERLNSK